MKGICQFCGCTEALPCQDDLGPCSWIDESEDLCSTCATRLWNAQLDGRAPPAELALQVRMNRAAIQALQEQFGGLVSAIIAQQGGAPLGQNIAVPDKTLWTPD